MVQAAKTTNSYGFQSSTALIMASLQFTLANNKSFADYSEASREDTAKIVDFIQLADRITNATYDDIIEIIKGLEDQYAALSNYISLIPSKDPLVKSKLDISGLRKDIDSLDASCKTVAKDLKEVGQKRIKAMQETCQSPASEVHPQIIKPLVSEVHQVEVKIKQAREVAMKLLAKMANKRAEIYAVAPANIQAVMIKPTPMGG